MDFPANLHIAALVVLCFAAPGVSDQSLETFTAEYGPFNQTSFAAFEVMPSATVSNGALQITPDSASADFDIRSNQGRVMLKRRFKLLQGTKGSYSDRVGSFYSSFLINIYRLGDFAVGEGLAFVVAPDLNQPSNSSGQYLGLTNSTTDGHAANRLLAIELDTFKEEFDPDANHVGLNVNSVVSRNTTSLTPLKIQLAPFGEASFFNVWVDYNGVSKVIEVYIAQIPTKNGQIPLRPAEPVLKEYVDLREVVNQYSYFGFSASTGKAEVQLNCILKWNLTVDYYPEGLYQVDNKSGLYEVDNKSRRWKKILLHAGISLQAVLLMAAVGLGFYRRKKRRAESPKSSIVEALRRLPGTPKEFHFKDLKKATNDFDEKSKLGQGGFGVVYRGNLQNEDLEVAVKWFSRESIKGQDDFLAELTIINRLRHKHLVRLLGWCHKNGKMLLVYEYMPNGSLDMHLFGNRASTQLLSWDVRYKIISGVVSALHYLHNEYNQRVVHRDLKASNIMLDSDFNARLGDFGLARTLDNEKSSFTEAEGVAGTLGYIAPECFHTGKATRQSDVYALGAVLLEVVCGRRLGTEIRSFLFLVDWVWSLHREGNLLEAVDRRLGDDYVAEEAQRLLLLGLACSHPVASERPQTRDIFQIVSGLVPVPFVPPFKPAFTWPAAPMGIEDLSQATSICTDSNCSGSNLTASVA